MNGNKTPGEKAPGAPIGVLAPAGPGASLRDKKVIRLTEDQVKQLADQLLYAFSVYRDLHGKIYSPLTQRSIEVALTVDDLTKAVLHTWGINEHRIVWDESEWFSVSLPIIYKGKRAFLVVSDAIEGYDIFVEGTDNYGYIKDAFKLYGIRDEPVFEVVPE